MLLAALPRVLAVGFIAGMLVMSIVVVSGRAERLAVLILHGARRPTALEAGRIAGPLRLVADRSGLDDLSVLIGQGGEPVTAAGCQHVILHREVVDAHRAGQITDADVAAHFSRGVGRLVVGQPRLDLLVTLWTVPWDFIRGLAHGVGRHLAWVPLARLAWQTRFVVGTIAVVLETQAARWPSPVVIAVFLALSYLKPACRAAWERRLTAAGDRYIVSRAAGSGQRDRLSLAPRGGTRVGPGRRSYLVRDAAAPFCFWDLGVEEQVRALGAVVGKGSADTSST